MPRPSRRSDSSSEKRERPQPIKAVRRDLFRSPLGAMELNKFAAVIADPHGRALKHNAVRSRHRKQETVVMISCNPTTFARDAALFDR